MGVYAAIKSWGPLLIYLGAIFAGLQALRGRVHVGLAYLLPLFPLQNVYEKLFAFPLGDNINDLLVLAMLVGWFGAKRGKKEPFFIPTPFNALLGAYVVWTYAALLRGTLFLGTPLELLDPSDPRTQVWKNYILAQIIFFLVVNNITTKDQVIRVLQVVVATMVVMNFFHLRSVGEMTSWVSRAKFQGTFGLGANEVAAFYASFTFVLVGIWIFGAKEIRGRLWLTALIACNFFLVLFLFSRGAYAATLIAFAFIALTRKPLWMVPIVFVLLFWDSVLPYEVVERLSFSEEAGSLDESAALRLVYWEQTLRYFEDHPFVGVGFNVVQYLVGHDTHNVWLRTLAEQGIVGAFFLASIFILAFKRGWRLYRAAVDPLLKGLGFGFCACTLAIAIGNLFGDRWTYLQLSTLFWLFLGLVERGNYIVSTQENAVFAIGRGS